MGIVKISQSYEHMSEEARIAAREAQEVEIRHLDWLCFSARKSRTTALWWLGAGIMFAVCYFQIVTVRDAWYTFFVWGIGLYHCLIIVILISLTVRLWLLIREINNIKRNLIPWYEWR